MNAGDSGQPGVDLSRSQSTLVVGDGDASSHVDAAPVGCWPETMSRARTLGTVKTLASLDEESARGDLKRHLGAWDLTALGIGDIIGTGIFVLTGTAAATAAGPAIVISFIVSGLAAALAALCYSEMASMIPVAGSAYTYTYATMGEFVAWIIGFDLILEYLVGAAAVAVGWSGYVVSFFHDAFGLQSSETWTTAPFSFNHTTESFHTTGAYVNLPAMVVILLLTALLVVGIRESAIVNHVVVVVKLAVIVIFIIAGAIYVNPENWKPFVPPNEGRFGAFGATGVLQGATIVFFAYIGFDAVSTTAQECKNPQRDLPVGILSSLVICTILYIFTALVLTGLVPYTELNVPNPIAVGIQATGLTWLVPIIEIGAIAGLTSVMLVSLMSQPRIFYSMANDGLLPAVFARVHPRFGTPHVTTITTGVVAAVLAGLLPVDVLAELTSVGTLFAFTLVSLGVMILRLRHPDAPRRFRVPFGPFVIPLLGVSTNLLLLSMSKGSTLSRLFIWMALGVLIYVFYGRTHSYLNNPGRKRPAVDETHQEKKDGEDADLGSADDEPGSDETLEMTPLTMNEPETRQENSK